VSDREIADLRDATDALDVAGEPLDLRRTRRRQRLDRGLLLAMTVLMLLSLVYGWLDHRDRADRREQEAQSAAVRQEQLLSRMDAILDEMAEQQERAELSREQFQAAVLLLLEEAGVDADPFRTPTAPRAVAPPAGVTAGAVTGPAARPPAGAVTGPTAGPVAEPVARPDPAPGPAGPPRDSRAAPPGQQDQQMHRESRSNRPEHVHPPGCF
jgi:hypothetical protein